MKSAACSGPRKSAVIGVGRQRQLNRKTAVLNLENYLKIVLDTFGIKTIIPFHAKSTTKRDKKATLNVKILNQKPCDLILRRNQVRPSQSYQ